MYCRRAAYRPSICTMILSPVVLYMWSYFEKLTKLVTYRRYLDRRNLTIGFVVWDLGYSTCMMQGPVHDEKAEKRGGLSAQFSGIIIFSIDSYYMDIIVAKSITKSFVM